MDKKIFTIQIDGIEKSYNDVLSLVDALKQLDNSNTTVTASTKKKTETELLRSLGGWDICIYGLGSS